MMKSVKWFLAVVVMFSLVLGGSISTAIASEHVTLQEIREETTAGWHNSYEVNGRTVTADIPIDVPNAHSFPVIRAGLYESLTPPQTDATITHLNNAIIVSCYDDDTWRNNGEHIGRYVMPNHSLKNISLQGMCIGFTLLVLDIWLLITQRVMISFCGLFGQWDAIQSLKLKEFFLRKIQPQRWAVIYMVRFSG